MNETPTWSCVLSSPMGRLGQLATDSSIDTPAWVVETRKAHLPHLPNILFSKGTTKFASLFHLHLHDFVDSVETIANYGQGISGFAASKGISFFSTRDPGDFTDSACTKDALLINTEGGRLAITPSLYMHMIKSLKPDFYASLSQDLAFHVSRKQTNKLVDRTTKWLDECIVLHQREQLQHTSKLFGVIQGSNSLQQRIRSAKETVQRPLLAGFVIGGLGLGESIKEREEILCAVVKELPADKPRLVAGVGSPEEILQCVELGIDLISSSYPFNLTDQGLALNLHFTKYENLSADSLSSFDSLKINMRDKALQLDTGPISTTCLCYCCKQHSRAYVHHLLCTHEMLGSALLNIHNGEQYATFFALVRAHLKAQTLPQFKELVLQCIQKGTEKLY